MGADADLIKLYSSKILALAADLPHAGRLQSPQGSAMCRSPQCGSKVTVDLVLDDAGKIQSFAQDVKACALGQASAAISGAVIFGATQATVQKARDELAEMLNGGGEIPASPFEGYEVLTPAVDFKNRHASILLTLDATLAAMDDAQSE